MDRRFWLRYLLYILMVKSLAQNLTVVMEGGSISVALYGSETERAIVIVCISRK